MTICKVVMRNCLVLVGVLALDHQHRDAADEKRDILTRTVVAVVKGPPLGDLVIVARRAVVIDQDQVALTQEFRVEAGDRGGEPIFQDNEAEIRTLRRRTLGGDVRAVLVAPASVLKPLYSELFELGFVDYLLLSRAFGQAFLGSLLMNRLPSSSFCLSG